MARDRSDKKVIVTAGATREYIDPIRFITNASTGKMGLELAKALYDKGFGVTLVRTVSSCGRVPRGIDLREVVTSEEMAGEVFELVKDADCLVMAAAVADLTPETAFDKKIKKTDRLTLRFKQTTDILSRAGRGNSLVKVGFALETDMLEENARAKLKRKNLSLIVANLAGPEMNPFGSGKKDYLLLSGTREAVKLEKVTKKRLAQDIAARIELLIGRCGANN